MIISITSLKGGVGKSTFATNIAVCLAHAGYKVAIIDTDTNASSVQWSGIRSDELPEIMVTGITDAAALRKNINKIHKDYDIVVIDGTPSISKLVSTILILGDIVLIPLKPSGFDIWAIEKFLEKYEQAKALREDIQAYFILNEYQQSVVFDRSSLEAIKELEIPIMDAKIKTRVAYKEAIIGGMGVFEYRDKKAKEEMVNLTNEIIRLLKDQSE
jgi:chromosome partitioning protein